MGDVVNQSGVLSLSVRERMSTLNTGRYEAEGRYFLQYISVILIILCFTIVTVMAKRMHEHMTMSAGRENPLHWMPASAAFAPRSEGKEIWRGSILFENARARQLTRSEEFLALRDVFRKHDVQLQLRYHMHQASLLDEKKNKRIARFSAELRQKLLRKSITAHAFHVDVIPAKQTAKEHLELRVFRYKGLYE